jgi:hypothetical protein
MGEWGVRDSEWGAKEHGMMMAHRTSDIDNRKSPDYG